MESCYNNHAALHLYSFTLVQIAAGLNRNDILPEQVIDLITCVCVEGVCVWRGWRCGGGAVLTSISTGAVTGASAGGMTYIGGRRRRRKLTYTSVTLLWECV